MGQYVAGKGPLGAKIMIVNDCPMSPFETDVSVRDPTNVYISSGLNRINCWNTYLIKEHVIPSLEKKIPLKKRCELQKIDYDKYINELRIEISEVRPNVIIACGGNVLYAITGKIGIQKQRGSILYGMGTKVIPIIRPDDLVNSTKDSELLGYYQRQVMVIDIQKAIRQSHFPERILPSRNLHIARNSGQLYEFWQTFKNKGNPAVDIEARHCIPICVGIAWDKFNAITVPLWNTGGISTIPTDDLVSCWLLLSSILDGSDVIGQNFGYDRDKIKRLGFTIRRLISDLMLKSFALNPELPKGLAFNTSIYTDEPYYKDEGMYEGSVTDLLAGCGRDACVTKEIDELMDPEIDEMGLRGFYDNFLMRLSPLYGKIENNGLPTDREIQKQLIEKYVKWNEQLAYKLFCIKGHWVNVDSWQQVDKFLYEELKIKRRQGTNEEVLTQILNNDKLDEYQKAAIDGILEKRRVDKTLGNYLLSAPDIDNRTRTSYFICLDTGRSATTKQEPPIRLSYEVIDRKGKKKDIYLGCAFQTMTKHGDVGNDIRSMYYAPKGKVFVQLDGSQAEARVIFLLAKDYQALEDIDKHDYHALTASWFFGGCEDDYSKKKLGYESPIRFAGKTLRHAGHLGASKRRAAISVNTDARKYRINYSISEYEAGKALRIFHEKQPNITKVFHAEVAECIKQTRRLEAPIPYGIDAKHGGIRTFFDRWSEELNRQAFSYIPQRTISEMTKGAALRIDAQYDWIDILLESHDSLLLMMDENKADFTIPLCIEEFEKPIDFSNCSLSRGILKVPAEAEIGYNYKDLSKYKYLVKQ